MTRTTKNKDPYHYHNYYVSARAPSAEDFVSVDENGEIGSDSNISSTSRDRYSQTSANTPVIEDEEVDSAGGNYENRSSNPPIAPKPKLNLSGELRSPSLHSNNGGDMFAPLPSPPTYKNAYLHLEVSDQLLNDPVPDKNNCLDNSESFSPFPIQAPNGTSPRPKFNAKDPVSKWQPEKKGVKTLKED